MSADIQSTHQKALSINLDDKIYGTIAEIGAAQEVARWFFRVGAAAGSVAKTISAYDMQVSDKIYGPAKRYVSRERLEAMLDKEYSLLVERLSEKRGADTRFFAFCNSVSARNFAGTNECQGWVGLRFQSEVGGEPNTIILHINMLDNSTTYGPAGEWALAAASAASCTPVLADAKDRIAVCTNCDTGAGLFRRPLHGQPHNPPFCDQPCRMCHHPPDSHAEHCIRYKGWLRA